jgi:hypothetical protein
MNATWKRKARVVQSQSNQSPNLEFLGKRKMGKNGNDEKMGKKNCNTCNKFWTKKFTLVDEEIRETENGSGMATAME